jgi:hypothetical protein
LYDGCIGKPVEILLPSLIRITILIIAIEIVEQRLLNPKELIPSFLVLRIFDRTLEQLKTPLKSLLAIFLFTPLSPIDRTLYVCSYMYELIHKRKRMPTSIS